MNVTSARQILGIQAPDPSLDEVRGAWRRFARANHPDVRPGDPTAPTRFQAGRDAYESLAGTTRRPSVQRVATTIDIDPGLYRPDTRYGRVLRGAEASAAHPYAFSHVTLREWHA